MRRKKSKFTKAEILNRAISSWENKQEGAVLMLRKSAEMLVKLRRKRQRMLVRATDVRAADELVASAMSVPPKPTRSESNIPADPVTDDIPGFLQRGLQAQAAVNEIIAEQEAEKKRKAERRIKKLKIGQEVKQAELTGQRRRMPLSGKDALAAIRAKG